MFGQREIEREYTYHQVLLPVQIHTLDFCVRVRGGCILEIYGLALGTPHPLIARFPGVQRRAQAHTSAPAVGV